MYLAALRGWHSSRRILWRSSNRQADNREGHGCRSRGGRQDGGKSNPNGRPEHDETTWCHSRVTEQERCAFLMTSYPSPHCLDSRMVTQRDQRPPRVLRDKKAPVGRISLRRLGSLLNRYFVAGKNYHFGRNSDKAPLHRRNFRRQGFANTQPKFPFTNHF